MNIKKYARAIIAVKPSRILRGEVGLFALTNIKKGSLITKLADFDESVFIPWKSFYKLDKVTRGRLCGFCAQYSDGIMAPKNINNLTIPCHINHSCEPNVGLDKKYNYVALRDIKLNEELTFDFSTIMGCRDWKITQCRCRSKLCRGRITANEIDKKDKYIHK